MSNKNVFNEFSNLKELERIDLKLIFLDHHTLTEFSLQSVLRIVIRVLGIPFSLNFHYPHGTCKTRTETHILF